MTHRIVNIKLPPIVATWARYHFGRVLRFPSSSNEAMLLRYHLRPAPEGYSPPQTISTDPDSISVAVPEYKDKPWPHFCHLSERGGQRALRQALRALMLMQLWIDMHHAMVDGGIEIALERWCKHNGVSQHEWRIKKEYYHMRQRYQACTQPIRLMRKR